MFRPIPNLPYETTSPGDAGAAPIASDWSCIPSSRAEGLPISAARETGGRGKIIPASLGESLSHRKMADTRCELRGLFSIALKVARVSTPL